MESPLISLDYDQFYAAMDYPTYQTSHSSHLSIPSPSFMNSYPSPTTTPSSGPPSPWHPDTPLDEGSRSRATSAASSRTSSAAVAAACLACRGKHLKCDGQAPCGRCRGTATECVYVASRRGYKGPRRSPDASPPRSVASPVPCWMSTTSTSSTTDSLPTTSVHQMSSRVTASPEPSHRNPSLYGNQQDTRSCQHFSPSFADKCLDSFYENFHPANSFVPSKEHLLRWTARQGGLVHLLAAIQWVGSLYIPCGSAGNQFFDDAYRLACDGKQAQDAWLVQTLLLLALGLDLTAQQGRARTMFSYAEAVTTHVALSPRPFATHYNTINHAVLDDCWNRTCLSFFTLGAILGIQSGKGVTQDAFMLDQQPQSLVELGQSPWSSQQQPGETFSFGIDPALCSSMATAAYFGTA